MPETHTYRAAFALVVAAPLLVLALVSPWMPLARGLEASAGWLFATMFFFPRMTAGLYEYLYPLADPAARRLVDFVLTVLYWTAVVPAAVARRLFGQKRHADTHSYWRNDP